MPEGPSFDRTATEATGGRVNEVGRAEALGPGSRAEEIAVGFATRSADRNKYAVIDGGATPCKVISSVVHHLRTAKVAAAIGVCGLLSVGHAPGTPAEQGRPNIAIEEVSVVDVVRGVVDRPQTVLVEDGWITAIGPPGEIHVPRGCLRVDGRGKFLMPGLVDMHVHLFNNATHRPPNDWTFPLFVANGVTAVREMAASAEDIRQLASWRRARNVGSLIAPRVVAAGIPVFAAANAPASAQVRAAAAAGADFAKVFSNVPEMDWRAIMEEARSLAFPVCGHVPAQVRLLDAAVAGQRSNEHLMQVFEACSAKEAQWLETRKGLAAEEIVRLRDAQEREVLESFAGGVCDETAKALGSTGQAQVPTLVLSHAEALSRRGKTGEDPRWRFLRADEQARWERLTLVDRGADNRLALLRDNVSREIVKRLYAAGVRVLAGTDAPMPHVYPGFSLHEELQLLVDAGLSTADALRAATIWPAEFLERRATEGSITVGQRADIVLLDANPLEEISATRAILAVVLDGRFLPREALNALLEASSKSSSLPR